jgi:hypothetical protein
VASVVVDVPRRTLASCCTPPVFVTGRRHRCRRRRSVSDRTSAFVLLSSASFVRVHCGNRETSSMCGVAVPKHHPAVQPPPPQPPPPIADRPPPVHSGDMPPTCSRPAHKLFLACQDLVVAARWSKFIARNRQRARQIFAPSRGSFPRKSAWRRLRPLRGARRQKNRSLIRPLVCRTGEPISFGRDGPVASLPARNESDVNIYLIGGGMAVAVRGASCFVGRPADS